MTWKNRACRWAAGFLAWLLCPITAYSDTPVALGATNGSRGTSGDAMLRARTIARRGTPAPGFAVEDFLFEDFGIPSGFQAEPEPVPNIDRAGNVSFVGIVGDDGVPGTGGTPAIFSFVNGALKLIARPGDPAPGTNHQFAGFPGPPGFPLESTPLIAGGRVAFDATTTQSSSLPGLWSDRFGEIELVAMNGMTLPDAPNTTIHAFAAGFEGSAVVINAAVYSAATDGLWRERDGGGFETIAIDGVPAPGAGPDVFFGEGSEGAFFGAVDGWDLNEAGQVVFQGYLMGPPVTCGNGVCEAYRWPYDGESCVDCPQDCAGQQSGNPADRFCCGFGAGENPVSCEDPRCTEGGLDCDDPPPPIHLANDEGIWADGADGLYLVVREGDPAAQAGPDYTFGSGGDGMSNGGFQTFSPETTIFPRINAGGDLLFGGRITSPEFYVKTSLWTVRDGVFDLIATAASGLDGPEFPGDPAPGLEAYNATFSDFLRGDLNDTGRVAFFAAAIFDNQPLSGTVGIWWNVPGELSLIAAVGEPVPGIPGAVYEWPMALLGRPGSSWNWVLFASQYTGSGANSSAPIFLARADGLVRLLLQPGSPVELETDEVKTVSSYQIGAGHADDGRYVFEMTFTDGTHGIYVIDLVAPVGQGDYDGDGDIDLADHAAFVQCMAGVGTPVSTECSAVFDRNDDMDVDLADFSGFQVDFPNS